MGALLVAVGTLFFQLLAEPMAFLPVKEPSGAQLYIMTVFIMMPLRLLQILCGGRAQ